MSDALNLTGFRGADRFRLPVALAGSFVFHVLIIGGGQLFDPHPSRGAEPPPPLHATLAAAPLPAARVLLAPETPEAPATHVPPAAKHAQPPPPPSSPPRRAGGFELDAAAAQALRQVARNLFYPSEAIERGLEGEALVTLFLDEAGDAVAARLERTSGHALLDEAAVRAARAVRALPDGAPREVLLPVRFRLR